MDTKPPDPHAAKRAEIVEWLSKLDPLSKTHWSWPLAHETDTENRGWFSAANRELAQQFARVTKAVSIKLCKRLDQGDHEQQCETYYHRACDLIESLPHGTVSLCLKYSPWHDLGLDEDPNPHKDWRLHVRQLSDLGDSAEHLRDFLGHEHPNIRVDWVLLDSEVYKTAEYMTAVGLDPDDWADWNAAALYRGYPGYDPGDPAFLHRSTGGDASLFYVPARTRVCHKEYS